VGALSGCTTTSGRGRRIDDLDFQLSDASRLRIVRRAGAGGMGVVYEALDLDRNVRVALKTLPETNPQTLYRFKHEFRALALHPRLVTLFDRA
jgi:serine/threonine protein kinase